MRFATYNIHHASVGGCFPSARRIARTLAPLDLDVVGLQEVWRFRGLLDQGSAIAARLGAESVYGYASTHGPFDQGNAVVSRLRVIRHRILPLPFERESRSCLITELDTGDLRINFAVTHLTLERSSRARAIELLARELPRDLPLVLAIDANATTVELEPLREWLEVPQHPPLAYPATSPKHAIDHIAYSRHWRLESLEAVQSKASDHLPGVAGLTLVY
ncbi:MAG: endonuclease/exonuclease/phosphatase family protein [Coriobacteriia bacterium]|nr:endonuclease/exonuclease/phosphatase family protein [Coriobacteriia bacterium]